MTGPSSAVLAGSRTLQVHDAAGDIRFPLWLLYPTPTPAQPIALGPRGLPLLASPDAEAATGRFPLVLLSHGGGSTPHVYRGTAAFLARRGFIVALPEHHRDNRGDSTLTGSAFSLQLRARHMRLAIDAVLGAGSGLRDSVAGDAVALIGHSMGGATALTVAGGQPWTRDGEPVDTAGLADPRVRALVLLAPAAAWFAAPGALRAVTQPLLLMVGEHDALTPPQHMQWVADGIPDASRVEHVVVPNAGHFAFLTPFPPALRTPALPPALDPPGFDRDAFHGEMNARILAFLRRTLKGAQPREWPRPQPIVVRAGLRSPNRKD